MISTFLAFVIGLSAAHASITNPSEKVNRVSDQAVQAFRGLEKQIGRPLTAIEKDGLAKLETRANARLRLASAASPWGFAITRLYCVEFEFGSGAGVAMVRCWSNARAYSMNTLGGAGFFVGVGGLIVDVEHLSENSIEGSYDDSIGLSIGAALSVTELRLNKTDSKNGAATVIGLGLGAGFVVKDDNLMVTIQAL